MDRSIFRRTRLQNAMLLFKTTLAVLQYDLLQLKASKTKTPKHGLYALVSYTYSKTYDNGLSDGLGSLTSAPYFPLPNWQNLERGTLADRLGEQLHSEHPL